MYVENPHHLAGCQSTIVIIKEEFTVVSIKRKVKSIWYLNTEDRVQLPCDQNNVHAVTAAFS